MIKIIDSNGDILQFSSHENFLTYVLQGTHQVITILNTDSLVCKRTTQKTLKHLFEFLNTSQEIHNELVKAKLSNMEPEDYIVGEEVAERITKEFEAFAKAFKKD